MHYDALIIRKDGYEHRTDNDEIEAWFKGFDVTTYDNGSQSCPEIDHVLEQLLPHGLILVEYEDLAEVMPSFAWDTRLYSDPVNDHFWISDNAEWYWHFDEYHLTSELTMFICHYEDPGGCPPALVIPVEQLDKWLGFISYFKNQAAFQYAAWLGEDAFVYMGNAVV